MFESRARDFSLFHFIVNVFTFLSGNDAISAPVLWDGGWTPVPKSFEGLHYLCVDLNF